MRLPKEDISLSPDLEWMLQSDQVSNEQLIGVLVHEQYAALYRFAQVLLDDPRAADQIVNETIRTVVLQRFKYWAHTSANAWIFAFAYKLISRRWYLTAFDRREITNPVAFDGLPDEAAALDQFSGVFEGKQKVLFLLRYGFHFTVTEIAQVMQTNKIEPVQARLDTARARLHTQLNTPLIQQEDHTPIQRQIRQAADGILSQADQNQLGMHLAVCDDCRIYARNFALFEDRLRVYLQQRWSAPATPAGLELAAISERISSQEGRLDILRRRLPFTFREAALVVMVIALASILTWYSLSPEPDNTSANVVGAELVDGNIVLVTLTPEIAFEAQVVQNQEVRRAPNFATQAAEVMNPPVLDSSAVSVVSGKNPQVFLDFGKINLDPYTDTFHDGLNNSGSVNLAMLLKYWGWQGSIDAVVRYLQPNSQDETVLYYEMENFVNEGTPYRAIWRAGGDISTLEALLRAGFPVMVQRVYWPNESTDSWTGAYDVLTGFDSKKAQFSMLPFYYPGRSSTLLYDDFMKEWQPFNYSYLVVFPSAKEAELMRVLGPDSNETQSFQKAANLSSKEIYSNSGMAQIYAWFNRGTNLAYLNDYTGAAEAYQEAFNLFNTGDSTGSILTWKLIWYQTRPYWAFYYTGQYEKVITLANQVIAMAPNRVIEESYYWRAMARKAQGDINGAVDDLNQAVKLNPNFVAGLYLLDQIKSGN